MAKRHSARSPSRRWSVPITGVRPPQRVSWDALLDLDPGELLCAQWLLRRLERRRHVGPRALARECGIRRATAVAFLKSPWRPWAEDLIKKGTPPLASQVKHRQDLLHLQVELRETLGTATGDAEALSKQKVGRR